jgi:hypothetical protein
VADAEEREKQEFQYTAMLQMLETDPDGFNQLPLQHRIAFAYWLAQRERAAESGAASTGAA